MCLEPQTVAGRKNSKEESWGESRNGVGEKGKSLAFKGGDAYNKGDLKLAYY